MKNLFLAIFLTLAQLSLAFEVTTLGTSRGVSEKGPFDRISASILLKKGESVTVEFFAYRENKVADTVTWISIPFTQPDGTTSARMSDLSFLTHPGDDAVVSMSAATEIPLSAWGSHEQRGWNVISYAARISVTGSDPTTGMTVYSGPFTLGLTEIDRINDSERLKLLVQLPVKELPQSATPIVSVPIGSGKTDPWFVDLPALPEGQGLGSISATADAAATDLARDQRKLPKDFARRVLTPPPPETSARVFFFTNRPRSVSFKDADPWYELFDFDAGRSDGYFATNAHAGWTDIQIPGRGRKKGQLSIPKGIPGSWGDEVCQITSNHKVWNHTNHYEFINELWKQRLIIYIHGFNNDFEEAITRAAQMKADMGWKGNILAIDWPSRGLTAAYGLDRELVETDQRNKDTIAWLLDALTNANLQQGRFFEERGARHLIAHSMGNEVLNQTVLELIKRQQLKPSMFQNMVFAAPDVFIGDFEKMISHLQDNHVAEKYTLYYSRKDLAVNTSRFVNLISLNSILHPSRILETLKGRAGITPHYYPGTTLINTDLVNSSWGTIFGDFRHGYFASSDKVLEDISALIVHGIRPENRRATLKPDAETLGQSAHYLIRP